MHGFRKQYLLFLLQCVCCLSVSEPSNEALLAAKQEAASADLTFFVGFLDDFNVNMNSYTSYMNEAGMTLPQDVANYYYHLKDVTETTQLLEDLATSFPFTEFKTFITAFPWYSSILSQASMTEFKVPQDFITAETDGSSVVIEPTPTSLSVSNTPLYPSSISSQTKDTISPNNSTVHGNPNITTTTITSIQSINRAASIDFYVPLILLPVLCYLF